jgi:hypothetical protein
MALLVQLVKGAVAVWEAVVVLEALVAQMANQDPPVALAQSGWRVILEP